MFNAAPCGWNAPETNSLTNIWRRPPSAFSAQVTHAFPGAPAVVEPTASAGESPAWVVSRFTASSSTAKTGPAGGAVGGMNVAVGSTGTAVGGETVGGTAIGVGWPPQAYSIRPAANSRRRTARADDLANISMGRASYVTLMSRGCVMRWDWIV